MRTLRPSGSVKISPRSQGVTLTGRVVAEAERGRP